MEKSGSGDEKVTNLEYLLKLSKGNNQFVADMIRIFLEENPAEIGTLEKAIQNRDYVLINAAAHKLRSTVPFVGIDKIISEEISEIESLAKEKAGDPMSPHQKPLESGLSTEKELIGRIEILFSHVKQVCFTACEELRSYRQ